MIRGLLTEAATQVKRAAPRICRGNAGEGGSMPRLPAPPNGQTAFFSASIRSVFSHEKPPSASGARPKWP